MTTPFPPYDPTQAEAVAAEFANLPQELALRIYTTRLLGQRDDLVLHGGGNTSVKLETTDCLGRSVSALYVKASGAAMADITPRGFTALDLAPLAALRTLADLPDAAMQNEILIRRLFADAPPPSVEALVHAFLPHKFIDHTHADDVLVLANLKNGAEIIRQALGPQVAVIKYAVSGFPLAKAIQDVCQRQPGLDAVVVRHHGIFSFGPDAKTAYERMITCVGKASAFIGEKSKRFPPSSREAPAMLSLADAARVCQIIRGAVAHPAPDACDPLKRFHVKLIQDPDLIEAAASDAAHAICAGGVLTPDHVIRAKNKMVQVASIPQSDEDLKAVIHQAVQSFHDDDLQYYRRHYQTHDFEPAPPDPFPRLFWVAGLGLVALGTDPRSAATAADIGAHTIRAKLRAAHLGELEPVSEDHVFFMEYWPLQHKKTAGAGQGRLAGQVALVTGGGGAIGLGVADRLLDAGAAVAIADIDAARLEKVHALLAAQYGHKRVHSLIFDVTDFNQTADALAELSCRLGGLDILVPNAGVAHVARIEDLAPDKFRQVIEVNLMGVFTVIKAAVPVFRRQGTGGNIVLVSTKNVFEPGAAFGAYSASKAGAHQMAKIAALELAELGVRVNMVNPDAVFGDDNVCSNLWECVGPDRMKSRGLDAQGLREYYRNRCLLKTKVLAEHVGNAVVFFAADLTPTTGASLPVDGGNPGAFPR